MTPTPEIPQGPVGPAKPATKQDGPMFAWTGRGDGELRDVSKPIAFDEHGNPLYATPRDPIQALVKRVQPVRRSLVRV